VIEKLTLSYNNIDDNGINEISDLLEKSKLKNFDIKSNSYTENGLSILCNVFSKNAMLVSFKIGGL